MKVRLSNNLAPMGRDFKKTKIFNLQIKIFNKAKTFKLHHKLNKTSPSDLNLDENGYPVKEKNLFDV